MRRQGIRVRASRATGEGKREMKYIVGLGSRVCTGKEQVGIIVACPCGEESDGALGGSQGEIRLDIHNGNVLSVGTGK